MAFGSAGGPGGDGSAGDNNNGFGRETGGYGGYGSDDGPDSAYGGANTGPGAYGGFGNGNIGDFQGMDLDNFSTIDSFGIGSAPEINFSTFQPITPVTPQLSDMFVDQLSEEERLKRMGVSAIGPIVGRAMPGPLGALAGNALGVATGTQTPGQMGANMFGSIASALGTALGGPLGGLVGGLLGRQATAGGVTGPAPGRAEGQNSNGSGNLMDLGQGLAGLYMANRASKDARNAQNAITSGVDSRLANMFGPNSAYAQQLRQQLDRRDAAGGRRSQYGPREVELQAKLAEMASRAAPGMTNAMVSQQQAGLQAAQAKRAQQNAMFNTLFGAAQRFGVGNRVQQGLNSLFDRRPNTVDVMGDGVWG